MANLSICGRPTSNQERNIEMFSGVDCDINYCSFTGCMRTICLSEGEKKSGSDIMDIGDTGDVFLTNVLL